jgi:hypothetical protein
MRNSIFNILLLAMAVLVVSCNKHKENQDETAEWPAMDDFHFVMAESFHPFKDSANIAPAIANATALDEAADKWMNSPLPEKVNNDEVKKYLITLKQTTSEFVTVAASADTTRIATALTKLHDDFHKIQKVWYGSGKDGDHKHEH